MMSGNPMPEFHPFVYPRLNMMVQEGSTVRIKDLKSDGGKFLNGKEGKALSFDLETGRWSTELEDGTKKKICIQNLEFVCPREGSLHVLFAAQREDLVAMGTVDGQEAICIFDNPKRVGFNLELIKESFLMMGVPLDLLTTLQRSAE
jgi:hypothetical protein